MSDAVGLPKSSAGGRRLFPYLQLTSLMPVPPIYQWQVGVGRFPVFYLQ